MSLRVAVFVRPRWLPRYPGANDNKTGPHCGTQHTTRASSSGAGGGPEAGSEGPAR